MTTDDFRLRLHLVETCRMLAASGLTFGTSGNVSIRRDSESLLISPSGAAYHSLHPEDMAVLGFDGRWVGPRRPSTEWRFHRDIMHARTDVSAIVHTHSPYATALACRGQGIPPFHYMVAVAGGRDIRCAPYHTFGTQELSDAAVTALDGRWACLLANHGVIALGQDLGSAFKLAGEVENLARQYLIATTGGTPNLLDDNEMGRVVAKFGDYGRDDASDPGLIKASAPSS